MPQSNSAWSHHVTYATVFGSAFRLFLIVLAFTPLVANRIDAQERLFTSEQAERGRDVYNASCAGCHGMQLDGGGAITPPLVGPEFLGSWSPMGRTVDDLHYIISATMPPGAANTLSANQRLFALPERGILEILDSRGFC